LQGQLYAWQLVGPELHAMGMANSDNDKKHNDDNQLQHMGQRTLVYTCCRMLST
jgi:hypothetical protein